MNFQQNPKSSKNGLIDILRPIILVNQFVGVCPLDIEGPLLVFRKYSTNFFKTIFSLLVLSLVTLHLYLQIRDAVCKGESLAQIANLCGWICSTLVSIAILCVTLKRRHDFTYYFIRSDELCEKVARDSGCTKAKKQAWTFYGIYLSLIVVSCILNCCRVIKNPRDRVYLIQYFVGHKQGNASSDDDDYPPISLIVLNCLFQIYLVFLINSAFALVEVFCSALAISTGDKILKNIQRLRRTLDEIFNKEHISVEQIVQKHLAVVQPKKIAKGNVNGLISYYESNIGCAKGILCSFINRSSNSRNSVEKIYEDEGCEYTVELENLDKYDHKDLCILDEDKDDNCSLDQTSRGMEAIRQAILAFHYLAEKQGLVNCLFGPLLALNTAWLIIKFCLTSFVQIRNWSTTAAKIMALTTLGQNTIENLVGHNNLTDTTIFRNVENENLLCEFTSFMAKNGGNIKLLLMLIRLLILLISLGTVFQASKWFDCEIIESVMRVNAESSSPTISLKSKSSVSSPANTNYLSEMIYTHLMRNQATPVCYSAAGFFNFSRLTILYAFSIITTYVVFLLQA